MRKTAIVINSILVVFFAGFLAYTFVGRRHLEARARGFVTEKTLAYSKPIVEATDLALDSPFAKNAISEKKAIAIRDEVADYRRNPRSFVEDLTRQHVRNAPVRNPNPLLVRVASIKEQIRTFYDNTLAALLADLRIFSISNLIAVMIALGLACLSSPQIRMPVFWFSCFMTIAVFYCSFLYFDDLTFFRILFRMHLGWWYAVLLSAMTFALYLKYRRHIDANETSNVRRAVESTVSIGNPSAAAR